VRACVEEMRGSCVFVFVGALITRRNREMGDDDSEQIRPNPLALRPQLRPGAAAAFVAQQNTPES
jgi:hypothetical protein